jgi:hypothetical protein
MNPPLVIVIFNFLIRPNNARIGIKEVPQRQTDPTPKKTNIQQKEFFQKRKTLASLWCRNTASKKIPITTSLQDALS